MTTLHQIARADDITVGVPIIPVLDESLEGSLGAFVWIAPLRSRLQYGDSVADVIDRMAANVMDAVDHGNEHVACYAMRQNGGPDRPRVVFTVSEASDLPFRLGDVELSTVNIWPGSAKFDLLFTIRLTESAAELLVEFATDALNESTVLMIADAFVTSLRHASNGFGNSARITMGRLSQPTSSSKPFARPLEPEIGGSIPEHVFAKHHAQDDIAVVDDYESLTRAELQRRSKLVAARLRTGGLRIGEVVAVRVERSCKFVEIALGIMLAGGTYLPVDPASPSARVEEMLARANCRFIIADNTDDLTTNVDVILSKDRLDCNTHPLLDTVLPDSCAYIIFTSGSTGVPKQVGITHRNVAWLIEASQKTINIKRGDKWSAFHSFAFDFSVWELWVAMACGGSVRIISRRDARDPARFISLLEREQISVLSITPSAFSAIIRSDAFKDSSHLSIDHIIFGGEKLSFELLEPWISRYSRTRIINMYGITEVTVHATAYQVDAAIPLPTSSVIGRALPGSTVRVMDRALQLVAPESTGEIVVAGGGVAIGYLGEPRLTAQRFMPDPEGYGVRLFRSGDLARVDYNGNIQYLHREDRQIKIRGHRVELGEIESAIEAIPGVSRAVILVGISSAMSAYVTSNSVDVASILRTLRLKLPAYAVPSKIILVDNIPLNINGKPDLSKLGEIKSVEELPAHRFDPKDAPIKLALEVWAAALGQPPSSEDSDFFEAGGDSLSILKVQAAANKRGYLVDLAELYRNRTPRTMASLFAAMIPSATTISHVEAHEILPITQIQLGMLYHTMISPRAYVDVVVWEYQSHTTESAVTEALATLIQRHEVLRTAFDLNSDPPGRLVQKNITPPVIFHSTTYQSQEEAEQYIERLSIERRSTSFSIETAPLFTLDVVQLTPLRQVVLFTNHHAILDGWSISQFAREFFSIIEGRSIPPAPIHSFSEYARLESDASTDVRSERFWRNLLTGPPTFLAHNFDADDVTRSISIIVNKSTADALRLVCAEASLPIKSVLLAIHLATIAEMTDSRDTVVTGLVMHGRPAGDDWDRVLGLFLNQVPLRVAVIGKCWRDLAQSVFEAEISALEHVRFPLSALRAEHGAAFDTLFNYVKFPKASQDVKISSLGGYDGEESLAVHASDGDELRITFAYAEKKLGLDRARAAVRIFETFVASAARDLNEQQAGVELSHDGDYVEPSPPTLPASLLTLDAIVARWARETGDKPAIIDGDICATYAHLEDQIKSCCSGLRASGVKSGDRVAVILAGSIEFMVTILAVHRIGAAYVPVDPQWPIRRIRSIITDAKVRCAIGNANNSIPGLSCNVLSFSDLCRSGVGIDFTSHDTTMNDIAYVMYTSGSTGTPKAVVVPFLGIMNRLAWGAERFILTSDDVFLLKTPVTFDVSVAEFGAALMAGATLVIASDSQRLDPNALADLATNEGVTVMHFVPSMLAAFLDCARALPALRILLCSGEALPDDLALRASEILGAVPWNLYGPTEASIEVTASKWNGSKVTIGRPITNVKTYIADRYLRKLPDYVAGELFIGGVAVTQGYFSRPSLTAERFIPDPYGAVGSRMYRTGDQAFRDGNGDLNFRGRFDTQVKLRGVRIELSEIEAAARRHPLVNDAAAGVVSDALGLLVATNVPLTGEEVRQVLSDLLPAGSVPSVIRVVSHIPVTQTGKVDRERVMILLDTQSSQALTERPSTDAERVVANAFSIATGGGEFGRDDDFFTHGGHSLAALRVISYLKQHGHESIKLVDLREARTVRRVGAILDSGLFKT